MNETLQIIIGFLLILAILYLLVKVNKKFRCDAFKLFLYAENNIAKGKKMDYVVNTFCDYLPFPLNCLPKSFWKGIFQGLFNEVHDLLDDGKRNKSNKKVK